jgi:hypothetical protein
MLLDNWIRIIKGKWEMELENLGNAWDISGWWVFYIMILA